MKQEEGRGKNGAKNEEELRIITRKKEGEGKGEGEGNGATTLELVMF